MSENSDSHIRVAYITGCFTLIAALIGGVFLVLSESVKTSSPHASNEVTITSTPCLTFEISATSDSLTLIFMEPLCISLLDLRFEIFNEGQITAIPLHSYASFQNITTLESPFCLRIIREGVSEPIPSHCVPARTISAQTDSVFWFNDELGIYPILRLFSADNLLRECAGASCSVPQG